MLHLETDQNRAAPWPASETRPLLALIAAMMPENLASVRGFLVKMTGDPLDCSLGLGYHIATPISIHPGQHRVEAAVETNYPFQSSGDNYADDIGRWLCIGASPTANPMLPTPRLIKPGKW